MSRFAGKDWRTAIRHTTSANNSQVLINGLDVEVAGSAILRTELATECSLTTRGIYRMFTFGRHAVNLLPSRRRTVKRSFRMQVRTVSFANYMSTAAQLVCDRSDKLSPEQGRGVST